VFLVSRSSLVFLRRVKNFMNEATKREWQWVIGLGVEGRPLLRIEGSPHARFARTWSFIFDESKGWARTCRLLNVIRQRAKAYKEFRDRGMMAAIEVCEDCSAVAIPLRRKDK
jgi:hypothetical protein